MSNHDMIQENQVEMVELSDEAMEAVAGGYYSDQYIYYNDVYIYDSDVFAAFINDSYVDIYNDQ